MKKQIIYYLLTLITVSSIFAQTRKDQFADELSKYNEMLTPFEGTTPAQWRITWTGDVSKNATISWSTAELGKKHTLHFGEKAEKSSQSYTSHLPCQTNGMYTKHKWKDKNITPGYYHHARLSDLKPDTNYYFILESDGEFSRQLYFRTAPASGTDFTIINGGDSRSGLMQRCRMNLMIAEFFSKNKKTLAFSHGGDYVNRGDSWEDWKMWLSHNELTTLKDGRVLPMIPTMGNHEKGPLYFETFGFEDHTVEYHTTELGKDVTLITTPTNIAEEKKNATWLDAQLSKYRKSSTWLIVQYHKPIYPALKEAGPQAGQFRALFEKYNVDLAMESDGHLMKRTVPIRNGKKDITGVTYVGEGGLGVRQRSPKLDRWYIEKGARGHHFLSLDFAPQEMHVRFMVYGGKVWDDHVLKARSK